MDSKRRKIDLSSGYGQFDVGVQESVRGDGYKKIQRNGRQR